MMFVEKTLGRPKRKTTRATTNVVLWRDVLNRSVQNATTTSSIETAEVKAANVTKRKNKIDKESEYVLIDSKSWIQTIPEYDYSKYLTYQSQNNYGFLIKFYKKRFMHIDLKAYLGNLDARNSKINIFIDEEKRIFNDEIHFFDHPYFGVVVAISEV